VNLERQNNLPAIEQALRLLSSHGYATEQLWDEHHKWLRSEDNSVPTEADATWATNRELAPTTEQHFATGTNEVLTAFAAAEGWSYRLSPGQRRFLRNRYGITPTMTVTVIGLTYFPKTRIISALTIRSDEHVPNNRQHRVLNRVVMNATEFFERSAAFDKEIEEANAAAVTAKGLASPSKVTRAQKQATDVNALLAQYANLI
jgi:hypothetical protein